MDQEKYIKKWLDGSLSEDERRAFEQTEDYRFLTRLDQSLQRFKAPDFDESVETEKLRTPKPQTKIRSLSWSNPLLQVAASLLIAVSAITFYLVHDQQSAVEITANQKSELYLPDSSFVELNVRSLLSFREHSWEKSRKVNLEGEAFFKVAHGSRFDVITPSGTVSVVGTQFNVKSRDDYFEIACFEGKVKVLMAGQEIMLAKGETWRTLGGTGQSLDLQLATTPDWLRGESQFQSVPFIYVVKELERQYDIDVRLKNINTQRLFTGSFAHDNINLALKSISLPLNLSYQLEEDQVLLSGTP